MKQEILKSDLVVAVFEPNPRKNASLCSLIAMDIGNRPISSSLKRDALNMIEESSHSEWHGAYVGNFGGEAKIMQEVIDAIKDKYPSAYVIGLIENAKFRVKADERIEYVRFTDQLYQSTLVRMLANANAHV